VKKEGLFLTKNKLISIAIAISCLLFIGILFSEKAANLVNIIPIIRGEVSLGNNIIITTINGKYPFMIKKDDPQVGRQLRFFGAVKSIFSETIIDLCKKNDVVIEVGSCYGYNSVFLGKKIGDNGKLYCLEPNVSLFSYLKKNIVINDLESNTILKNIAVSNVSGNCNIDDYFSIIQMPDGSYTKPRTTNVECSTVDQEVKTELKPINLLVLDVPGQEFFIMDGASRIMEHKNIIVVFVFYKRASSKNVDVEKELRELHDLGFRFYKSDGKNDIFPITIEEILQLESAVLVLSRKFL
jgi:FkbM family methyltransferase